MSYGDKIIAFVDRVLDFFNLVKGYLDDALAFFEKLKDLILELVEYAKLHFESHPDRELKLLEEEHFFI